MSEKYQEGQIVKFNNGFVKGIGKIRGIATIAQPVIGINYIVERYGTNLQDKDYPYSCITVFECHIQGLV
jgi:hypothetical protein